MDALGIAVVVAVLVVATTIGLWRRRTDGLIRDEAAAKKGRASILASAGLDVPEMRDRTTPTTSATTAARAASTAAAAAVPSARTAKSPSHVTTATGPPVSDTASKHVPGTPSEVRLGAAPGGPGEGAVGPGGAAGGPGDAAVLGLGESVVRPGAAPVVPGGDGDVAGSASVAGPAEEVVVVPDVREEPGVVEAGPPDAGAAGEHVDRGLLDRLGVQPAQVTLLQFSSAFCAPCRAVRRVSAEVAGLLTGVRHVEVDAESHLAEVRELNIWRTPTLLILDAEGRVLKRATGVPSKPQLIAAVGDVLAGG